jgi:hypothetical protein
VLVAAAAALLSLGGPPVAGLSAGSASAQDAACPVPNPTYTGNCGPTFVLPSWGDAGGWSDPSQYSTIQLADIDGDGRDELLGRGDSGLQVHEFDTTVGQWRPQIRAAGVPALLADFRSPLPSETPVWTEPQYYTTIQTGDIDGEPGEEVVARFPDGLRVYKYTPGAGGAPGSWAKIKEGGPFSDAAGWGSDPSLYSTIQTADVSGGPEEEIVARTANGIEVFDWHGLLPEQLDPVPILGSNADGGQRPEYYTDIVTGRPLPGNEVVAARDAIGVHTAQLSGKWSILDRAVQFNAFGDTFNPVAVDCPFSARPPDCFGSSPSYYETLQLADVDGDGHDELLGRAADGLRVKTWGGPSRGWTANPLPTLTALAGPASTSAGIYGSIETANLDGQGGREVLALDGTALQAWSYDPQGKSWNKLSLTTPLALGADPWLSDPSTFSTIQTGDVDGNGTDEVIARGPFGIRAWFYDRRHTGGWERYLPEGYTAFSTAGEQNAFAELQRVMGKTIRDVWASENPPQPTDLTGLQGDLVRAGDCTDPNRTNPVRYATCTPPAGSSGFTGDDWTAVVNELLAETYWAGQVVSHFTEVKGMLGSLYLNENQELPAIGSDLQLQAAANAQRTFDIESTYEEVFQIMGAIAGLGPEVGPVLSAALSITGDVLSMLPSSSSSLMTTYNTTFSQLQNQFATGASEVGTALDAHSQEVRQDLGLLTLVGQLRSAGTWKLDAIGAESAGREGFSLWAYKTLLGAVYARYQISSCQSSGLLNCQGVPAGLGVIGGGANFTAFGPPPSGSHSNPYSEPCHFVLGATLCIFQTVPDTLRKTIWGDVSPQCAYVPGNAETVWNFGCSLGVTTSQSDGWNAPTYTGSPGVWASSTGAVTGVGSGRASVRLAAQTALPRSVNLRRARVSVDRVLHEPRGIGELLRPRPSGSGAQASAGRGRDRRLTPIVLTRIGKGRRGAVRLRGRGARGLRAMLLLRKRGRSRLSFALRMPRAPLPVAPAACNALPAELGRSPAAVQLHTRLRIADGRRKPITLTLRPHWRCRRDRTGTIRRLSVVRPKRPKLQPGLALRLRGPRTVRPGATARFSIGVRNHRAPRRDRLQSSFWNAYVHAFPSRGARLADRPKGASVRGGSMLWPFRELRGGKTRSLQLRVRAPRSARRRICVQATVSADLARPAGARRCARMTR